MADGAPVRRMPKRAVTVNLPSPYEDFQCTLWVNYPPAVQARMMSADLDVASEAFGEIVINHNLVDFDGEPYPTGSELYRALPAELVGLIYKAGQAEVGKLPKGNAPS